MKDIDLTEVRQYITELVLQAGKILKKYFESGKFTSRSKGGVDLLTEADEEVDQFLRENIQKQYPKSKLLTEETAPEDYSSLKNADNLWIIDPLDGTVNFSRHHPHFAISVGLVNKGVPQLSVVYLPIENKLYWAQADRNEAFLNGKPIKVSTTGDLKEVVFCCDWGWNLETRITVVKWLEKVNAFVRQIKCMGSAVADLASLADGSIDIYLHSGLKPWDTAASSLLIEKAGGKITTPNGDKWNVFNPEMLASNGILHTAILNLLNK
ncbi:MAG: inositol monophosphatase family protein [Candidatus Daviesbacteria bacterium]|nr:inositol monophosphatase family protein [Candidatus Daviesbacteria bacterium]